jgi:hypothetical protein
MRNAPTIKAKVRKPVSAKTPALPELAGAFETVSRIIADPKALQGLIDSGLMRESVSNMLLYYSQRAEEIGV